MLLDTMLGFLKDHYVDQDVHRTNHIRGNPGSDVGCESAAVALRHRMGLSHFSVLLV